MKWLEKYVFARIARSRFNACLLDKELWGIAEINRKVIDRARGRVRVVSDADVLHCLVRRFGVVNRDFVWNGKG